MAHNKGGGDQESLERNTIRLEEAEYCQSCCKVTFHNIFFFYKTSFKQLLGWKTLEGIELPHLFKSALEVWSESMTFLSFLHG